MLRHLVMDNSTTFGRLCDGLRGPSQRLQLPSSPLGRHHILLWCRLAGLAAHAVIVPELPCAGTSVHLLEPDPMIPWMAYEPLTYVDVHTAPSRR